MSRSLITLTTDFGTCDHFVGTMKGVIYAICPRARIVDITHELTPYERGEAGFVIAQAYRYFPKGTIHVVVIDPGVGSARRPILCEGAGQYFVAPDNGVLSTIYAAEKHRVRVISNPKLFLKNVSRTFHGRDVFAPAAAHLAKGMPPTRFGARIEDYVRIPVAEPVRTARRVWTGTILKADRFGNLITNFHIDMFPDVRRRPFEMSVGLERVNRLARNYAETALGDLFVIEGSSGYLEVSANQASAAKKLGCGAGSPVELEIFYD